MRPLITALLLALAWPCAPVLAQTTALAATDLATLEQSAKAAMQAKDWPQALRLWDRYLAQKPEDDYGHRMRGRTLRELGRGDEAITAYYQATELAPGDANVWNGLCWAQIVLNRPIDARPNCQKAVDLDPTHAVALANLGHTWLLQGDSNTARQWYRKSLLNLTNASELANGPLADFDVFIGQGQQIDVSRRARAWFKKSGAAWLARSAPVNKLLGEAIAAENDADYARAVALRERRLPLLIELVGDSHPRVANARAALIAIVDLWADQLFAEGRYAEALSRYQRVLSARLATDNTADEIIVASLNRVATSLEKLGRYAEAEPIYRRALLVCEKALGTEHLEVSFRLYGLASLLEKAGRYAEAEPLFRRALAISEKANGPDHPDTGSHLNNLANLLQLTGRYAEAEALYRRALSIAEKSVGSEHPKTGTDLNNLAMLLEITGRYAEAEPLYRRALIISEKTNGPEHPDTGSHLNNLANLLQLTARYAEAEALYRRALSNTEKSLGSEHPLTSTSLGNLALLLQTTGRYAEAEPISRRALAISEKANGPEHPETYASVNNLASLLDDSGRHSDAEPLYRRALAISEKANGPEHRDTGIALNNLAGLIDSMGRHTEAEPLYRRALAIAERALGAEHPDTALRLSNLAGLLHATDRATEAEPLYLRAWRIANTTGQPALAWNVQDSLRGFYAKTHPELAIWYGKQAVNTLQAVRAGNTALDKETQKSFLEKNESTYKRLADLLFAQGRLVEGQQVLALLKDAEYVDFVQRGGDARQSDAAFTAQERPWSERYEKISGQLAAMSKEREALLKRVKNGEQLAAAEQSRKEKLDADLALARQAYDAFLADLKKEFTQGAAADRQQEFGEKDLASLRALQGTLRDLGHGAVTLHYLLTDQRLWILLTTPTVQLKREAAIGATDLNRLIGEYRAAIARRDPQVKAQGKALYDLLVAPVADDLKQAGAQTLMLSLDGALRYLPMAALYDGEQYLAQRYRLALYTSAAKDKLKDKPQAEWTLAGYGLTQKVGDFAALPSVKGELDGILQGMKGKANFDQAFTAASFKTGLENEPPVVHLASHFVFKPGDETDSFLLLGDGKKLSLKEIKDGYEFVNLDLLTLSACETAVGGGKDANGREVEGFGALAQNQGAKGVIATLWPVADESTGQFMQLFYGLRQKNPGITKAEAIQLAQAAFIERRVAPALAEVSRGLTRTGAGPAATATDHPYYWAPFILMGNWL